jgi:AraC-like DNA-binding protein
MATARAKRGPAPHKGTVLARVVANVLSGAEREGMPREALFEAAGLGVVDLADPDARAPLWAYVALWQLIAKRATDPGVGIRMGEVVTAARRWGLLGYAMYYSSTLGAALRRLARYGRLLVETVEFRLEEPSNQHVAVAECSPALGVGLPYAVSYSFAVLVGACREITRAEVVPAEVAFAHDPPGPTAEYHRFFRCPLRFGQPLSKVTFVKHDLDLPVPLGDETLAGYLSESAERVLQTLLTGSSTTERVRAAIWAGLSEGPPTLHHVASALHLPPRTLQRRLAAEGTTLHREIEHIRRQMAVATLQERTVPIEEVAFILGYAEPSTFYRSFKRWTGKTPRQYRAAGASPIRPPASSRPR